MDWQVSCKWKEICKKELSSLILTSIYPCSILAGCVDAPRGYGGSRGESTPRVADSASTKIIGK
jgi:hypothetical protein